MTAEIANQIQIEQDHGRSKYGNGPLDFAHDDRNSPELWASCIADHNQRAQLSTPMDRRQHLIKLAGLAVSAVESIDRKLAQAALKG